MSMQRALSFLHPSGLTPRSGYASIQTRGGSAQPLVPTEPATKTGLHLKITNTEPLHPGNPLELAITVKISEPGNWTVDLTGSCQLQYYTGTVQANLGTTKETINIEGPSGKHRKLPVFCRLIYCGSLGLVLAPLVDKCMALYFVKSRNCLSRTYLPLNCI